MTAAVAPAAPRRARDADRRRPGHRRWQPPADTGGAPLTRFAVRIDGKRVVAGRRRAARSSRRAGRAGGRQVRAFNVVRGRRWAAVAVAVPAYPSIDGPTGSRRAPGSPSDSPACCPASRRPSRSRIVKSGKLTTRTIDPRNDGTATLRLRVQPDGAGSRPPAGGIRSAVHRIGGFPTKETLT